MINLLKDLIEQFSGGTGPVPEPALDRICAALMLQLSAVDRDQDAREEAVIRDYLARHFGLTAEEAETVLQEARDDADKATSLYELTSLIDERCDEDQKTFLIYQMWCLAHADGNVDQYEEHFIRRTADLLHVPRVRLMRAKHDAAQDMGRSH